MTKKKPRNLTRVSTYVVAVSISILQYLPVFPSLVIACPSFPTGIPFAPGACWMPACLSTSLSKKNPVILHVHDFPSETVVFCFPLFFSKKEPIAGVIPSRVRRLKSGKSAERGEPLFPDWPVPFSLASNAAEQNSKETKKAQALFVCWRYMETHNSLSHIFFHLSIYGPFPLRQRHHQRLGKIPA